MRGDRVLALGLSLLASAAGGSSLGDVRRVEAVHVVEVPVVTGLATVTGDGTQWLAVWYQRRIRDGRRGRRALVIGAERPWVAGMLGFQFRP